MNRRGASLLELVVALMLTALLGVVAWKVLADAAYRLRDRSERMSAEHAIRVAAGATRAALESLGRDSASGADLAAIGPRSFVGRVLRGAGVVCAAAADRIVVRRGLGWWSALREPVPGRDSLLVAAIHGRPGWIALGLRAAPGTVTCPDGGAAMSLPVAVDPGALAAIGTGSALRMVEGVEFRVYSSGGEWLGIRAVQTGEAIQPLAGPLGAVGVDLVYLGPAGATTSDPAEVRSVVLRVNGLTERAGGIGLSRMPGVRPDSLAMFVALVP